MTMGHKKLRILSLTYQRRIRAICELLPTMGLRYCVMYIIFNNHEKFVLSNLFHLLLPYYYEDLYKEDYSYQPDIILGKNYYLCDRTASVSHRFKTILENEFKVHRAYSIVRRCPECTFVFSAIRDAPLDHYEQFYKATIKEFEEFCVYFVDRLLDVVIDYSPGYRHSFILTNAPYRRAVITQGYHYEELSSREKECLILASQGKTTKEIAKTLNLSPHTVETYSKKIKEKFQCATMMESVIEGIHRGIIGSVNHWEPFVSEEFHPMLMKMKKTNLILLNDL